MDRFLGQEIEDARERVQYLRDNADAVEDLGYTKTIPSAKLDELKERLVENNIQLRDVRADKKAANKGYNDQIKQLEEEGEEVTAKLKARTEYVVEPCYKFVEGSEVGYYNADGVLVFSRPARPDERQLTVFTDLRRTGTDN